MVKNNNEIIKDGTAITNVANALSTDINFFEDAGLGTDNLSVQDQAIPFLSILQTNSPQVDANEAKYIENARPGDILNNVNNKLYKGKEGVLVVPCGQVRELVEWLPRETGGGFVASHPFDAKLLASCTKTDKGFILPNNNQLVETVYHFVILAQEESWAIVPMTSTKLTVSKKWNSSIIMNKKTGPDGKKYTPAIFASLYNLKTIQQENKKGKFYNFDPEFTGFVQNPELYAAGKQFFAEIEKGTIKISNIPNETIEAEDNTAY